MNNEIVNILTSLPVLKDLPISIIMRLSQYSSIRTMQKGSVIQYYEDQSNYVYSLLEGIVKAHYYHKMFVVEILIEGEILNLSDILVNRFSFSSFTALVDVKLLLIDKHKFTDIVNTDFVIQDNLIDCYRKLTLKQENRLFKKLYYNSTQKLGETVIDLCNIFPGNTFPYVLTQEEIASVAGISLRSFNKIFCDLVKSGVISYQDRLLKIVDLDLLKKKCNLE